jgi:hypothetical protein
MHTRRSTTRCPENSGWYRLLWLSLIVMHAPLLARVLWTLSVGRGEPEHLVTAIFLLLGTALFTAKLFGARFTRTRSPLTSLLLFVLALVVAHRGIMPQSLGATPALPPVALATTATVAAGVVRYRRILSERFQRTLDSIRLALFLTPAPARPEQTVRSSGLDVLIGVRTARAPPAPTAST